MRPLDDPETLRRDVGLVLVGAIDRRVLPALGFAATLQDFDIKAVHFAVDDDDRRQFADAWLRLELDWAPLEIEDVGDRPFLSAVQDFVRRETDGRSRVVVIVPELDLAHWWQFAVHRGVGRRIARSLQTLRAVWTVVVPYPSR